MAEAAIAVRDWAWKTFPDLARIQAFCMVENVGSRRVMEKMGMKPEGIQRKGFWNKGEAVDIAYFAIFR